MPELTIQSDFFSSPLFLAALVMVGGAACAFFGYRLMRLWLSVSGFILGAGLGMTLCKYAELGSPVNFIVAVLLGAALAWLCFRIIRVGAFVLAAVMGYTLASFFLTQTVIIWVIALIFGILGTVLLRSAIIVVSAIGGGFVAAQALTRLVTLPQGVWIILWLALAVGGMVYQFHHSPRH